MIKIKEQEGLFKNISLLGILLPTIAQLFKIELIIAISPIIGFLLMAIGYKRMTSIIYPLILVLILYQGYSFKVPTDYLKYTLMGLLLYKTLFTLIKRIKIPKSEWFILSYLLLFTGILIGWRFLNLREVLNQKLFYIVSMVIVLVYGIGRIKWNRKNFSRISLGMGISIFIISHIIEMLDRLYDLGIHELSDFSRIISLIIIMTYCIISIVINMIIRKTAGNNKYT